MNILVVNDDGIETLGLRILAKELSFIGDVYVVAPCEQKSGAGQSINMNRDLVLQPIAVEGAKMSFSLEGSPADCVKLGLAFFSKRGIDIDLVVSGINYGGNLGGDVLYSGTVGAGREALMTGIMSVAVSVDNHLGGDFEKIAIATRKICESMDRKEFLNPRYMLNINFPNVAFDEIKGFKAVKLGIREYVDWYEEKEIFRGTFSLRYGGDIKVQMKNDDEIETDVEAVDSGYISVTPLKYDTMEHEILADMKGEDYEKIISQR